MSKYTNYLFDLGFLPERGEPSETFFQLKVMGGRRLVMHPLLAMLSVTMATMLAACGVRPTFTMDYTTPAAPGLSGGGHGTCAVRRFADARPPRRYTTQGRAFLLYVPLLPSVSLPFERLDASVMIQSGRSQLNVRPPAAADFAYEESIPQAIGRDLAAAALFREVVYVGGDAADGYDYVLEGTLRESPFRIVGTTYGLGAAGVFLWPLGVPNGRATGRLVVDLVLRDATSGTVLWRRTLDGEAARFFTLYTPPIVYGAMSFSFSVPAPSASWPVDQRSMFAYHAEALRRAMAEALPELAQAMAGTAPAG